MGDDAPDLAFGPGDWTFEQQVTSEGREQVRYAVERVKKGTFIALHKGRRVKHPELWCFVEGNGCGDTVVDLTAELRNEDEVWAVGEHFRCLQGPPEYTPAAKLVCRLPVEYEEAGDRPEQ
mmetsp:Transcript_117530/g.312653  ORF Transcript_117530/g.312653 Transcript_117530/m.312653 type:complete len:121 (-) Transcript_117530:99-461(-)